MISQNYTQKMSDLKKQVGQYATDYLPVKKECKSSFMSISSISSISSIFRTPFLYVLPSMILIVLLLICKPSFCCQNHIDKDNVITKKLKYKKVFITGVIGGFIFSIGLFAYLRKR